ncbi:hypothetical protein [Rasiella sp. SM2506]|uniref:hypothetical protein n=1 Tax=Rasiella sp. SM2506 TaxID=3423914 RepID=UPI003D7931E7
MSTEKKNKDHADFQDTYRRSSNFGGAASEEEQLNVAGDGNVKLTKDNDMISREEKQKIVDAMDKMQRKFENTDDREKAREEEE